MMLFDYSKNEALKNISLEEMISIMLQAACKFLEHYTVIEFDFYQRHFHYKMPYPIHFQPSSADKLILRQIMTDHAQAVAPGNRCPHNAKGYGKAALFCSYYPLFDQFNQTHPPE